MRDLQVVYIDSDPHMHQAFAKVLMALGVTFRCYKTYEEARQDVVNFAPEVIFFDLEGFQAHAKCEVLAKHELALMTPATLNHELESFAKNEVKSGRKTLSKPLDRHEIAHYLSVALYKEAPKAA